MDHARLGYPDGDGPGKDRINESRGLSVLIRRWTPIIVMRENNTTCISTNVYATNGQMKELERAFGVYVSWNSARLGTGGYVIYYTRSHDMSADIYTKGSTTVLYYRGDAC